MQTQSLIEEMQRQAKLCETIAQDKTEESLTGAPDDKEINECDAREWTFKIQSLAGSGSARAKQFDQAGPARSLRVTPHIRMLPIGVFYSEMAKNHFHN
ncbi:MAG: hypothetical protein WDM76_07155 [Limisphaerales bacterium]